MKTRRPPRPKKVAPTLRGGRGLKLFENEHYYQNGYVAPTLRGGRGLKRTRPAVPALPYPVAPTLRGGRGLKHGSSAEKEGRTM